MMFQREHVRPGARTDNRTVSQLDRQASFSAATVSNQEHPGIGTMASPLLGPDELVDATSVPELLDFDGDQDDTDKEIDRVIADLLKAEDEVARLTGELQKTDTKIHGLQRQVHELEILRQDSATAAATSSTSAAELEAKMAELAAELACKEQELADKTLELADKETSWHETVQQLRCQHKAEEQKWQQELAKLQTSENGEAGGRDESELTELQRLVDFYEKLSEGLSEKNSKLEGRVELLTMGIAERDREVEEHIAMIQLLHGQSADAEHA